MLSRPERHTGARDELIGQRADERKQTALHRALVQLDLVAQRVAPDHVEQRLQRRALGVQQQLGVSVEDAQVAEHLALRREEGGVRAVPGLESDDVLGHLALEEILGVPAGERELAPLRAIEQSDRFSDGRVVGLEIRGCAHSKRVAYAVTRLAERLATVPRDGSGRHIHGDRRVAP